LNFERKIQDTNTKADRGLKRMGSVDVDKEVKSMTKNDVHILFVTIAFSGHFGPFVQLMYNLESKHAGIRVTVWGTKDRLAELRKAQSRGDLSNLQLHLEEVFGAVPVHTKDSKFPVRAAHVSESNFTETESQRKKLVAEKSNADRPTCIISDMFQYWSKVSTAVMLFLMFL
jgi:hypothetical protein